MADVYKDKDNRMHSHYFDASQSFLKGTSTLNRNPIQISYNKNLSILSRQRSDMSESLDQVSALRANTKTFAFPTPTMQFKGRDRNQRRQAIPAIIDIPLDLDDSKKESDKRVSTKTIRDRFRSKSGDSITNNSCLNKLNLFLKKYLEHNVTLFILTLMILFVLFGPDLKAIIISLNYDYLFNVVFLIVMFCFFVELGAGIWVKVGYLWSFFFWLDLLAAASMIMEIDWFLTPMVDIFISWTMLRGQIENKSLLLDSERNQKVAMFLRILRIIRLIRIVKLYKAGVVFYRNYSNKKRLEQIKQKAIQRDEMIRQKEMSLKRREEEERSKTLEKYSRTIAQINRKNKTYNSGSVKLDQAMSPMNNFINNTLNETSKYDIETTPITKPYDPFGSSNMGQTRQSRVDHDKQDAYNRFYALIHFQKQKNELEAYEELPEETKISKVVSESITKKVIIIILILLFVSPIMDDDSYSEDSINYSALCQMTNAAMQVYGYNTKEFNNSVNILINSNLDDNFPIISITNLNYTIYINESISDNSNYRVDEIAYIFLPGGDTLVTYSNKTNTKWSAVINLVRTIFACCFLFYMAYQLEQDSKLLILNPLELMINIVDTVAQDPVNYKSLESLNKNIKNSIDRIKNKNKISDNSKIGDDYEIKVLQFAIVRISALMAIVFGEAGGLILKENINSTSGLNPMLPGKKINAIFGFCYIRHFADINTALQEKTMVFVNQIAEIVHSSVDKFGGATNKNIGEAFLSVWKFNHFKNEYGEDKFTTNISGTDKKVNFVADQALLGFLNIIKKINKSLTVIGYKNFPEIKTKFGNRFKVQMGFGLHQGWGIEGAIGSFYKIDCSYLSPNVNIAARLETATSIYGVDILISGQLYDLLSPFLQGFCRLIDIVALKGCATPVKLYTVDLNTNIKLGKDKKKNFSMRERRKHYMSKKTKLLSEYEKHCEDDITIGDIYYLRSKGIRSLLKSTKSEAFLEMFDKGFNAYVDGNWVDAYKCLKAAVHIDRNDGPTKTLINFLKKHNKRAPIGWDGFRKLENKG